MDQTAAKIWLIDPALAIGAPEDTLIVSPDAIVVTGAPDLVTSTVVSAEAIAGRVAMVRARAPAKTLKSFFIISFSDWGACLLGNLTSDIRVKSARVIP